MAHERGSTVNEDPMSGDHRADGARGGTLVLAAAVAVTVVFALAMRTLVDRHRDGAEPEEKAAPVAAADLLVPLLTTLGQAA